MYLTAKDVKELSLEKWDYLTNHPEIRNFHKLPEDLYERIRKYCTFGEPLCKYFNITSTKDENCKQCPLYGSCQGRNCEYDEWCITINPDFARGIANRFWNKIRLWDIGDD